MNNLKEVIIKPIEGGSSIGVNLARSFEEAVQISMSVLLEYGEVVVEKKCEGQEFTVIILENNGKKVALVPSEIENTGIFDTRKKYLCTEETTFYCPPRFTKEIVDKIRVQAEQLFEIAGARDFLRIDGWVLQDNSIYFCDFNPISGAEQNSFIFQQSTRMGFTHESLLIYIINNALARNGLPKMPYSSKKTPHKKPINVLLGGVTSEKNISLMSGANVWLKLMSSKKYSPTPYVLFTTNGEYMVQKVPYPFMLNHTTEEMMMQLNQLEPPAYYNKLVEDIIHLLQAENYVYPIKLEDPLTLTEFILRSKKENAYVFLGLHGGFGENGDLQKILEDANLNFNGASSNTAKLCMDKYLTGKKIDCLGLTNVRSCLKMLVDLSPSNTPIDSAALWQKLQQNLKSSYIVSKPNDDGCSTGVVVLHSANDLEKYLYYCSSEDSLVPENTFWGQQEKIQLCKIENCVLFEEYIQTDTPIFNGNNVEYLPNTNWVELTVGVIEENNSYHCFLPSLSIAESQNGILSLEEKFQGGTGINMTPPPENIVPSTLTKKIQTAAKEICKEFAIKDYCRIDLFVNNKTEEIIIIEINTLPALSPSTVLFQQASKEDLSPLNLLEKIIKI